MLSRRHDPSCVCFISSIKLVIVLCMSCQQLVHRNNELSVVFLAYRWAEALCFLSVCMSVCVSQFITSVLQTARRNFSRFTTFVHFGTKMNSSFWSQSQRSLSDQMRSNNQRHVLTARHWVLTGFIQRNFAKFDFTSVWCFKIFQLRSDVSVPHCSIYFITVLFCVATSNLSSIYISVFNVLFFSFSSWL